MNRRNFGFNPFLNRDSINAVAARGLVLEEITWDRSSIALALGIPLQSIEDVPIDTNETKPYSFHIIGVGDVDDMRGVLGPLYRKLRKPWGSPQDVADRRLREAIFQTDFVEQLLELGDFDSVTRIGETHQERSVIVSRGMAASLAKYATCLLSTSSTRRPWIRAKRWSWAINNFVYYLDDDELTTDMIRACMVGIRPNVNRSLRLRTKHYSQQVLERVALRGPCVQNKFPEDVVSSLKAICIQRAENLDSFNKPYTLSDAYFLAALASMSSEHDIGISGETIASYRRYVLGDGYINPQLLAVENNSRKHLHRSGYLRPGESIYMYLGMCGCSSSNDVRFFGALRLALQIQALKFDAKGFNPYDTISAHRYAERAHSARLQNDARLLRCEIKDLPMANTARRGPHALFAETVLQIGSDTDNDVRLLGEIAWSFVPTSVQRQAVWCPSLHTLFCRHQRDIVILVLMMARRGDIPIPVDILVRFVFPMACDARADNMARRHSHSRKRISSGPMRVAE